MPRRGATYRDGHQARAAGRGGRYVSNAPLTCPWAGQTVVRKSSSLSVNNISVEAQKGPRDHHQAANEKTPTDCPLWSSKPRLLLVHSLPLVPNRERQ